MDEAELARPTEDDLSVWKVIAENLPYSRTSTNMLMLIAEVRRLREENEMQDMFENQTLESYDKLEAERERLQQRVQELEAALRTICDIGETRDVLVARAALGEQA